MDPVDGSVFGTLAPNLSVALPDGRTLAVSNPESLTTTRPVLWTSADGLAWDRLQDAPAFRPRGSGCSVSVADVVRVEDGLAAVGLESCWSSGRATALAWSSPDGLAWTAASVDRASGGSIEQVVPTPSRLVGLGFTGFELPRGEGQQDASTPAEWTSADGRSWTLVEDADRTPVGGVVAFGGAYYGLVSLDPKLNASGDLVAYPRSGVYTSRDALRWRQVAGAPAAAVLVPRGGLLVGVGPGAAAVSAGPTAWASADGAAWPGSPLPSPVLSPGAVSPDEAPWSVNVSLNSLWLRVWSMTREASGSHGVLVSGIQPGRACILHGQSGCRHNS